jgi:chromosome segregation ATPase
LAKKVAEKVPTWISRIQLPEIRTIVKEEISNQLKPIEARISALDEKVDERTKALDSKIEDRTKALDAKISSLRNEMNARFDSIEKRLPLIERLVLLEARIEKIEKHIGIH